MLAEKPEIVALNKIDALLPEDRAARAAALGEACGQEPRLVSGASGQGVRDLLRALMAHVQAERAAREALESADGAPVEAGWRP